ncbi:MAG: nicotinamide mononucleotide transporter [Bacteroidales bacterium]|nr:nicotinamide mononucleotide transporter [Bacteroidales bacterium]
MNYELIIEIIAVATGLLSVWYSKKINVLVFPIGIISVLLYVFIFIKNGLFANAVINFLYFVISVFGWWNWVKDNGQQTTDNSRQSDSLSVSFLNRRQRVLTLAIVIILLVISKIFTTDTPTFLDYFTGVLGLGGMLLTALKKVENWVLYLLCDIILIPLCIVNGLYLTVLQYIIYAIIAVMGYISWSKEAKKNV